MNIKRNVVYETEEYGRFKRLAGNRDITERRKNYVRNSIMENGYIFSPIIVNEKFEVVDGQARLEVLEELGMRVHYIVEPGLTVDDCKVLNLYQTKWTAHDFIESYAELGNVSYKYLKNLITAFPMFNLSVLLIACNACFYGNTRGQSLLDVKAGNLVIDALTYENATSTLTFLTRILPSLNKDRGNMNYMLSAIIYAIHRCKADKNRMAEQIEKYYATKNIGGGFTNIQSAIRVLTDIYNYKQRGTSRVNFSDKYDELKRAEKSESVKRVMERKKEKKAC